MMMIRMNGPTVINTESLRATYQKRMSISYANVIHDLCDEVDRLRAELAAHARAGCPSAAERLADEARVEHTVGPEEDGR